MVVCGLQYNKLQTPFSRSAQNSKRLLQLIGMQFIRYYAYCMCMTQALFVLINRAFTHSGGRPRKAEVVPAQLRFNNSSWPLPAVVNRVLIAVDLSW
jgi:hypothetical protein